MTKFSDLSATNKISKLLKEKMPTTKEAKDFLNEAAIFTTTYVLTVLKETSEGKEISEAQIQKVFETLKKR
jgi:hypothetical protein